MSTEYFNTDNLPMEIINVVHCPRGLDRSLPGPNTSFIYWDGIGHRVMYKTAEQVRRCITLDNIRKNADFHKCEQTGKCY
jgi:hypothetical protein